MNEVIIVQPTSCTEETCSYQATLYEPVDSRVAEDLMQQVEWWYQEAKSLNQKQRESTMKVVQLSKLLKETRCSLRSKLDESNEKIAALSIENSFFKRQNSTVKCEELLRERESLMFHLSSSSRPDYRNINELEVTVEHLTVEKMTLQEQYEDLNARLQTMHSNGANEAKLHKKLAEMKLENAKLNKQNKELKWELREITEKSVQLKQQNEQLLQVTMEKSTKGDEYKTETRSIKRAQSLNLTSAADIKASNGCTDCMKKILELNSLKIQLIESEKDLEQTKRENMKMTTQIDFLQGELLNHKNLAEELSIKAGGSRVDNFAASAEILTIKKSYHLKKFRMQLPPPRYHYQLRVYQMWIYIHAE